MRARDLDRAVDELRLGRDLDRLRDAVEGQVAGQGDVRWPCPRAPRPGSRPAAVSVNVAVGNWSVWRPSSRRRLSRCDLSEEIVVVSTVSAPAGQGRRRAADVEGDGAGDLVGPADRVALGRQVGELLADAVAGDALGRDVPVPATDPSVVVAGAVLALVPVAVLAAGAVLAAARGRGRREGQGRGAVAAQDLVVDDETADADRDDDDADGEEEPGPGHVGILRWSGTSRPDTPNAGTAS